MNSRIRLLLLTAVLTPLLQSSILAAEPLFPEGNLARGETLFETHQCFRCHTLENKELPDFDLPATLKIHLGGSEHLAWTRDTYAKAIMNPEHVVSPQYQAAMIRVGDKLGAANSPMPHFNTLLTVADLIDLATFLSAQKPGQ